MLKIARVDGEMCPSDSISTLKLEGKLIGPWVDELRRACDELATPPSGLHLNLSAVTFIDSAGINLLGDLQEQLGLAYLFIAHDLSVVRHISHRIAVMYLGRIVETGPADEVYRRPTHPYTQALLSAIPIADPVRQRQRERIVLHGEMPSPQNPPSGCRFHTRCPYVMDVCRQVDPPAFETAGGSTTWCHLHTTGPALAGAPVSELSSS